MPPLQLPTIVIISADEYKKLVRDSKILSALEQGGVDNWDWYSDSINQYCPEVWEE